jgi:hypothetical protein
LRNPPFLRESAHAGHISRTGTITKASNKTAAFARQAVSEEKIGQEYLVAQGVLKPYSGGLIVSASQI